MLSDIRLSVIIPTYNRAELLRLCLETILSQRRLPDEIIVVDDGSTDHTSEVAASFKNEITYIKQANAGPGSARNTGASHATGDYLVFLDSDDCWWPWTLAILEEAILASQPRLISFCHKMFQNPDDIKHVKESPLELCRYESFYASSKQQILFSTSSAAVRRKDFLSVGGFSSAIRVAEDLDLALRMGDTGGFSHVSSPPMIALRRHETSLMQEMDGVFHGMRYLIDEENNCRYPGGPSLSSDRRNLISYVVRGATIRLMQRLEVRRSFDLYCRTFTWHLASLRFRYLLAYPLLLLKSICVSSCKKIFGKQNLAI